MTEHVDIYNANYEPCGTMERQEAHRTGKWHQTLHVWVVNGTPKGGAILIQHRSSLCRCFPNFLDISAAGHIRAGEDSSQALREVNEELGIEVKQENLHFLGLRVEVNDWPEGDEQNREFIPTFMYRCDQPLTEYAPQIEEVEGLYWLPISAALSLFSRHIKSIDVEGIILNSKRNGYEKAERTITVDDFVPRKQNLYLTIAIMAERLIEGRFPIAVS